MAEPLPAQYVYKAAPRRKADLERSAVMLSKFNCTGCHTSRWIAGTFDYDPASPARKPAEVADYPFLEPHFTPQQIEASMKVDRRGLGMQRSAACR